jgi:hypothetical protein
MPRKERRVCACDALIRDGRCTAVPSCSDFKRPAMRQVSLDSKLKRRERQAHRGLPTRREVVAGAAEAMSRAKRTVRGCGDATNPATLEAELASGRW